MQQPQRDPGRSSAQPLRAAHAPPRRAPASHRDSSDDDSAIDRSDRSDLSDSASDRSDDDRADQPDALQTSQPQVPRSSMQQQRGAILMRVRDGPSASQPQAASSSHPRVVSADLRRSSAAAADRPLQASTAYSPVASSASCVPLPCTILPLQSAVVASLLPSAVSSAPSPCAAQSAGPLVRVWQDVLLSECDPVHSPLRFITLRNSFVAAVTIRQLVFSSQTSSRDSTHNRGLSSRREPTDGPCGQVWRTVLDRFPLMTRPHEDSGGQTLFTIAATQLNRRFDPSCLTRLRFEFHQSSPLWIDCCVTDIRLWTDGDGRGSGAVAAEASTQGRSASQRSSSAQRKPPSSSNSSGANNAAASSPRASARLPAGSEDWLQSSPSSSSGLAQSPAVLSQVDALLRAMTPL